MKKAGTKKTPVRNSLRADSALRNAVVDGLGAVASAHRDYFDSDVRSYFADSLDIDAGLREGREQENRWDYLVGHRPSGEVVAVEPHSAKQDEVSAVIEKRRAARQQLAGHLVNGARITKWLWVASGKVHFADTEKARRRLDQAGIEFVGTRITERHLPKAPEVAQSRVKAGKKRK